MYNLMQERNILSDKCQESNPTLTTICDGTIDISVNVWCSYVQKLCDARLAQVVAEQEKNDSSIKGYIYST